MKLFFDLEFTGLHQHTTPISIGLVSADGRTFYAEFLDYDFEQIDDWIKENVIANLQLKVECSNDHYYNLETLSGDGMVESFHAGDSVRELLGPGGEVAHFCLNAKSIGPHNLEMLGTKFWIIPALSRWLAQFDKVEMWGDCLAYDWILFCELFGGGAECLPRNVFYIPFDISTVFKLKGIDPDISRQEFAGAGHPKHNALWDAVTIKACYEGLMPE